MRILVTGGTGFIGSHLIDLLLEKNHDITVLIRKNSDPKYIKKYLEQNKIKSIYGNLEDSSSLTKATKDIDLVYNAAAYVATHDKRKQVEKRLFEINTNGAKNLFGASLKNNVEKIVHFSSIAAIGPIKSYANEKTPCNPVEPYGKSKLESEKIGLDLYKKNNLPITIVRPSTVYGPRDVKLRLKFFKQIKENKIKLFGKGDNLMPFVHVKDIAKGCIQAASSKKSIGEIYILSSDKSYPLNQITRLIADELKVKKPAHIPLWLAKLTGLMSEFKSKLSKKQSSFSRERVNTLTNDFYYDISKAKKDFGYLPSIGLKSGLKETINWYKENDYL